MKSNECDKLLQRLTDRLEIQENLYRYARGVDRGDWDLVRSAYHSDAYDEHGPYKGSVDGLIDWLEDRFAGVDNSTHFLGNCLIEFFGDDKALVETYYVSRRLREPVGEECGDAVPADRICREGCGRYVDIFERRDGEWRVADRKVVQEASYTYLAKDGARSSSLLWGRRDASDLIFETQRALAAQTIVNE